MALVNWAFLEEIRRLVRGDDGEIIRSTRALLSPQHCYELSEWALAWHLEHGFHPQPAGPSGHWYMPLSELPSHPLVSGIHSELRSAIPAEAGEDDYVGNIVSILDPGSYISHHHDSKAGAPGDLLRVNIILSAPYRGGEPFFPGRMIEISPGTGWAFLANRVVHGATSTEGELPRINLSFGWYLSGVHRDD